MGFIEARFLWGLALYTADDSVEGQALLVVVVVMWGASAVSQVSPQRRERAAGGEGVHHPAHTPTDTYARPSTVLAPTSLPHLES